MTRVKPVALVIGEFQPVRNGHIQALLDTLGRSRQVIVALMGHASAPSIRYPWTTAQRELCLRDALPAGARERVTVIGVRHHLYRPERWLAELQAKVAEAGVAYEAAVIVAAEVEVDRLRQRAPSVAKLMSASAVRQDYLRGGSAWREAVPVAVAAWLDAYRADPRYARLTEEQAWADRLAASWRAAPYPPIFVTADPVVVAQGHILLVHRKNAPGKGLWALPGGFVEHGETVAEAALRELVEETGIAVPLDALRRAARGVKVFDYPERSVRVRTITHGLFIDLGDGGSLPALRAGDDAASAEWWPLERFARSDELIAEDHAWIVRSFIPDLP